MEDKRLNINRPLLSVRRVSSMASTSSKKNENRKTENYIPTRTSTESYKSSFKLDPLKNTGNIPFVWEHTPGRPKDETNKQTQHKQNAPRNLPKLPPGRISKHKKRDPENIPRRKDSENVQKGFVKEKSTKSKSPKSSKKSSSDSTDDEAFMDALDTLSSSFYNCSASGVSGAGSGVNPPRVLPVDPIMHDIMMGRFLPAAKAMATAVHQTASKKHVVKEKEKPRELKKLTNNNNNNTLQLRYGPNFLQDITRKNNKEEEEKDEEEDSDYDHKKHGKTSSPFCGLVPRVCSKGSLSLVSPVPRMCSRSKLPICPVRKNQATSSSVSSLSEVENQPARTGIYEHRSIDISNLSKHKENKSILKNESTETTNIEGSGLYNRLQGRRASSASRTEFSVEDTRSQKKGSVRFKDLLADNNNNETGDQEEKTLFVDVHVVESSRENSVVPKSVLSSLKAQDTNFKEIDKKNPKACWVSSEDDDHDPKRDMKKGMHNNNDTVSWKDPEVDMKGAGVVKNGDRKLKESRSSGGGSVEVPPPPPLPKSPSDSWLCRTLPTVSSRNAPLRWNRKHQSSITLSTNPESESDHQTMQLRYPQEPLLPIPES